MKNAQLAFIIALITAVITTLGLSLRSPSYEASALISFDPTSVKDEWDLLKDETRSIDFEEQIRSRTVLATVLRDLGLPESKPGLLTRLGMSKLNKNKKKNPNLRLENAIRQLRASLTVERLRHSSLVRVTVQQKSPEQAAKEANAVANAFMALKRQQFLDRSEERLRAVEREIIHIRQELTTARGKRNTFLKENGWDDFTAKFAELTTRATQIEARIEDLQSVRPGTASAQVIPVDDQNLNQLVQKLNDLETRYIETKSRFKESSPPLQQIERERSDLKDMIREHLDDRLNLLRSELQTVQNELQKINRAEPLMEDFRDIIQHAEKQYQALLDQRAAIQLRLSTAHERNVGFGDLQILDPAIAPEMVTPVRRALNVIAGTIASLLITWSLVLALLEIWTYTFNPPAASSRRTQPFSDKTL